MAYRLPAAKHEQVKLGNDVIQRTGMVNDHSLFHVQVIGWTLR